MARRTQEEEVTQGKGGRREGKSRRRGSSRSRQKGAGGGQSSRQVEGKFKCIARHLQTSHFISWHTHTQP